MVTTVSPGADADAAQGVGPGPVAVLELAVGALASLDVEHGDRSGTSSTWRAIRCGSTCDRSSISDP